MDHITLAATAQGLSTCWIGSFKEIDVKQLLGIPEKIRVITIMPLGYPADVSTLREDRLPLSKTISCEHW
ncbi:MAG: hypothetical protein GYA34_07690 [Chloroflexi bacterium]|nr:hypothetical protein [Chloroflexota bacterium]